MTTGLRASKRGQTSNRGFASCFVFSSSSSSFSVLQFKLVWFFFLVHHLGPLTASDAAGGRPGVAARGSIRIRETVNYSSKLRSHRGFGVMRASKNKHRDRQIKSKQPLEGACAWESAGPPGVRRPFPLLPRPLVGGSLRSLRGGMSGLHLQQHGRMVTPKARNPV